MKLSILLHTLLLSCLVTGVLKAQDTQFSQFYANTMYMNPAFTGGAHNFRAHAHQRIQWPNLEARYSTSVVSIDHYMNEYKSGFGLMIMQDYQGGKTISNTSASLLYSYELPVSDDYTVRSGLQFGYVSRTLGYADLTFPYQYNNTGKIRANTRYTDNEIEQQSFVDVSSGFMLYSDRLWLSVAGHHINYPNQSFLGEVSRLPARYSVVGGYKFPLAYTNEMAYLGGKEVFASISPTFHYKSQGKSDQADIGLYGIYDFMMAGVWYRGIPFKRYESNIQNNEAIVALIGVQFESFDVRYSYDFTLSELASVNAGGAHEIGISYILQSKDRDKPTKSIPCPSFQTF